MKTRPKQPKTKNKQRAQMWYNLYQKVLYTLILDSPPATRHAPRSFYKVRRLLSLHACGDFSTIFSSRLHHTIDQ